MRSVDEPMYAPLLTGAIGCVLAWGALAFGCNYPWAYTPLGIGAALTGIAMLATRRATLPLGIVAGLACVAVATVVQLVPVPSDWLRVLSPAGDSVLREYQLGYAMGTWGRISIAPDATLTGLALFAAFSLFMIGVGCSLSGATARRAAGAIVLLGVAVAVIGIVQRATFTGKIYGFWEPQMGGSVFGPFVNRNHFAGWMLMAVPLAAGTSAALVSRGMRGVRAGWRNRILWISSPEANQAILVGAAALLMALSLVLTMSRSGMLALAVAIFVMTCAAVRRHRTSVHRTVHVGYLAALVVLVVFWVGADAIAARFEADSTVTLSGRFPIWHDTLAIARDFWLTGTGLNTYGVATLFYQTSVPQAHLREAHSDYLQLAAEGGLLLGIPVLLTVMAFVAHVRRRFRDDEGSTYWIRAGAVTGIVAIAVQSIAEFSLQMPGNAVLFAALCGIALHDGSRRGNIT